MSVRLAPPFRETLTAAPRPLVGMWLCSGSPTVAEICAGSGIDWLLVDAEHSPNDLSGLADQLRAIHGYPATPVVRPPVGSPVTIKQYLDLGVQNLLIPMVDTADQAADLVAATHYPPRGVRGVGSALARASRWGRETDYLARAAETIALYTQIESPTAVENVDAILAVDGVDGIFVGPSDLAASLGVLGEQDHPEVVSGVRRCVAAAKRAGKPIGVNAFAPELARGYLAEGVDFILVGADVQLLARGSERLVANFIPEES